MRRKALQANLVFVESIHQRIKRLRAAAGLSQQELAKRISERSGKAITYQSVQEWEKEGGTAPSRKRQADAASVLGVSVQELMTGEGRHVAREPGAEYQDLELAPREETFIRLYRQLMPAQQVDFMVKLAALSMANEISRRQIEGKPLRGVADEKIEAAFGKVSALERKKIKKAVAKYRRALGDAMGDYLDE